MNDLNKLTMSAAADKNPVGVFGYLKGLWEEILRTPLVQPDEDFFSLGGDSALVIEMLVAVSAHFDHEFKYNKFFSKPTLTTLSEIIVEELKAPHGVPCA
jgi:acyl carrier protein